jgi:hypothetical protein
MHGLEHVHLPSPSGEVRRPAKRATLDSIREALVATNLEYATGARRQAMKTGPVLAAIRVEQRSCPTRSAKSGKPLTGTPRI